MVQGSNNSLFSLEDNYCYEDGMNTNATSTLVSPTNSFIFNNDNKNIILLVGLPATGKSTISKQLMNHLNLTTKYKTKIFNCGDKRRQTFKKFNNYEFFDPNNEISKMKRDLIAVESLHSLISELNLNKINIGVLDATNTTIERRSNLINLINNEIKLDNLIILDIQCNDLKLINYNIQAKTKNDDYKNYEFQKSIDDFTKRLQYYMEAYQPVNDEELSSYDISSYIMVENAGSNYSFKNYKESNLINLLDTFFIDYANNQTKIYYQRVDEFYKQYKS